MGRVDEGGAVEGQPPGCLFSDRFVFLLVGFPTMAATGGLLPAPVSYFFAVFGCLATTGVYLLLSRIWPQLLTGAAICGGVSVLVLLITLWGVLTRNVWWTLLLTAATVLVAFIIGVVFFMRRDRRVMEAEPRGHGPNAR
ncbi:hypothetical protein OG864_52175 [Streptomyces sp. NBC_00124]|uniref:hypothetical protein n=1 Tax=Streptomyces sp. NBC_00124 TaxID=2975662 RepID=UPI00225AF883|nr:hypothetical protein [Streptomyces sp. NBC_00124]MCX5367231.1 hypothetical protein [Streptomyces sp. NBC_00124]